MKEGTSLTDAAERRGIELAISQLVFEADVEGLGRCVGGRNMTMVAAVPREEGPAPLDGGFRGGIARNVEGRSRRKRFQVGGQIPHLVAGDRLAVHGRLNRFLDLPGQVLHAAVPGPRNGLGHASQWRNTLGAPKDPSPSVSLNWSLEWPSVWQL